MFAREVRASKGFATFVVCLAVFTDTLIYGLVIPVLPFSLSKRAGLRHEEIQRWNSLLLSIYGAAIAVGSSKSIGS